MQRSHYNEKSLQGRFRIIERCSNCVIHCTEQSRTTSYCITKKIYIYKKKEQEKIKPNRGHLHPYTKGKGAERYRALPRFPALAV